MPFALGVGGKYRLNARVGIGRGIEIEIVAVSHPEAYEKISTVLVRFLRNVSKALELSIKQTLETDWRKIGM